MRHSFWHRWLLVAAGLTVLAGAAIALLAALGKPSPLDDLVASVFVNGSAADVALNAAGRLSIGLTGAVLAGWGAVLWVLARGEVEAQHPRLWSAMAAGLCVWFVLDNAASIANGAHFNLLGNTAFLGLLLPPMLGLRARRKPAVAAP